MALTRRQKIFVRQFSIDFDRERAAIAAGYKKKSAANAAYRLLKIPEIASAVDEFMVEAAKRNEITPESVLRTIQETIQRCSQHKPVLDRSGRPVMVETPDGTMAPAYTFDAPNVLKGTELLGRHIGLFPTKTDWRGELTVKNDAAVPRPMSYEEWLEYQRLQAQEQGKPQQAQVIALPAPKKVNGG